MKDTNSTAIKMAADITAQMIKQETSETVSSLKGFLMFSSSQ